MSSLVMDRVRFGIFRVMVQFPLFNTMNYEVYSQK